jgi:hypothetical protein
LLAACAKIGIDPSKALETTAQYSRADLLCYTGQLPFFGQVTGAKPFKDRFYPWFFTDFVMGSAAFADGLVSIEFVVELPWVLAEANTYTAE